MRFKDTAFIARAKAQSNSEGYWAALLDFYCPSAEALEPFREKILQDIKNYSLENRKIVEDYMAKVFLTGVYE